MEKRGKEKRGDEVRELAIFLYYENGEKIILEICTTLFLHLNLFSIIID